MLEATITTTTIGPNGKTEKPAFETFKGSEKVYGKPESWSRRRRRRRRRRWWRRR